MEGNVAMVTEVPVWWLCPAPPVQMLLPMAGGSVARLEACPRKEPLSQHSEENCTR